jgi:hypothetical protein
MIELLPSYFAYSVHNPTGPRGFGFLLPLFGSAPNPNQLYLQNINELDIVTEFSPLEEVVRKMRVAPDWTATVGERAVHAFALDPQEPLLGTKEVLSERLQDLIGTSAIGERPLLDLELIEFCNRRDLLAAGTRRAFDFIHRISPVSADHWRDWTLFSRLARRAVARLILQRGRDPVPIRDQSSYFVLKAQNDELVLWVDEALDRSLGPCSEWGPYLQTELAEYLRAFDLARAPIEVRTRTEGPSSAATTTVDLYRVGGAVSVRLDRVRPIDVRIMTLPGGDWVLGRSGGISSFANSPPLGRGRIWRLPAGTEYDSRLSLIHDHGNHFTWAPAYDMPLREYIAALASISAKFVTETAGLERIAYAEEDLPKGTQDGIRTEQRRQQTRQRAILTKPSSGEGVVISMQQIAVMNESTVISDADVQKMLPAFDQQWNKDLGPVWGVDAATFTFVPRHRIPAAGSWWLVFLDNSDQADALAYHDLTNDGMPISKVFVKTLQSDKASVSVGATHELCSMAVDPWLNSAYQDPKGVFWAGEVCDPVASDQYGYRIGDVLVTDFITPNWFVPEHASGNIDFQGHLHTAFAVLPGGYAQKFDPRHGWVQVAGHMAASTRRENAPHGSRRERRSHLSQGLRRSEVNKG